MNTFYIHEANMERLEKSLATIQKKCNKNQMSFHYEVVGEEYKTIKTDDEEYTAKFYIVEVEGSVKFENWKFVAVLDHHESGNIIRAYDTTEVVPERFKTCGPTCEHCNKIRSRKDTYLITNTETGEWKQVGKSCLREFTNGIDAETVALLVSMFEKVEGGYGYSGSGYTRYFEVAEMLRYSFECYRHFGYEKSSYDEEDYRPRRTTRQRVSDYYSLLRGYTAYVSSEWKRAIQEEIDAVGFNPDSNYAKEYTQKALEWIKSVDVSKSDYLRNLSIITSEEYSEMRNFGMLVSLSAAYMREVDYQKQQEQKAAERNLKHKSELSSDYQGEVGQRLSFNVTSFVCLTCSESMYGTSYLYKIIDENNNVYIWWGSRGFDEPEAVKKVTGTVKGHDEYNGIKQTQLTRCKVEY